MGADHERLLSEGYLADVASRSLDEVRQMRDECVAVETGLSYQRRLVQGPLDLVRHELDQRAAGGGHADLAALLADLPDVLADGPRGTGNGRLSAALEPTVLDEELAAELDAITAGGALTHLGELDDEDLATLASDLGTVERRISDRRRAYHHQIDELQAEITRRYRDGEASVDALLSGD